MSEPTDEQVNTIRQQVYDEELRKLIRDTIEQLERLGDRLESHVYDAIAIESTGPGSDEGGRSHLPPQAE